MKPRTRRVLWIVVALLALATFWVPAARPRTGRSSLTMRLLGPLAGPVAAAQWVRVDLAIRAGRTDLALARAETAFELAPTSTSGWFFLSRHLAFDLASPDREPDAAVRQRWVEAALALAARGEAQASDPAELAFWQGLLLAHTAEIEPELARWGGAAALWERAAGHFERAAQLGHPDAAVAATSARELAADSAR
ncbi:MAG: hypothetical protein NTV21_07880 [Planctomycetota bacterium]|nr:hypothetical protein [Planctomycetota bacterium]